MAEHLKFQFGQSVDQIQKDNTSLHQQYQWSSQIPSVIAGHLRLPDNIINTIPNHVRSSDNQLRDISRQSLRALIPIPIPMVIT